MKTATNIPARNPLAATRFDRSSRAHLPAKCINREPKAGEVALLLDCPQARPAYPGAAATPVKYAAGDLIVDAAGAAWVVTSAKCGYTMRGDGWRRDEQMVTARPATPADHAAVAAQLAAREAAVNAAFGTGMDR